MQQQNLHIIKNIVIALAVTLFFSCKSNFKEVNKIGVSANEPIGVSDSINVKYTDSGRMVANMQSKKMLDYSNRRFSFSEFPEGVTLYLYGEKNEKTTIISDYGIVYNDTDLIDLQGNVIAITEQNDTLYADQLYYNQEKEWLFTNLPVTYISKDYVTKGRGFDSDKDFEKPLVLGISGLYPVVE